MKQTKSKEEKKEEAKQKAYALHPSQEGLIEKRCFNVCKKINVAMLKDEDFGLFFVCCSDNCPFQKSLGNIPIGESQGREVWVRCLK